VKPCCSGKAISITYSEFVSAGLVIQRTMRMRHIVICGQSGCTILFSHFPTNGKFSTEKNIFEHKMCSNFLYNFPIKTIITLRRIPRDTIKIYIGPHVKKIKLNQPHYRPGGAQSVPGS